MKATIRVTKYDYRSGLISDDEPTIVRVTEITHCLPTRGGYSLIMLTNGASLPVTDTIAELERAIDEAEGSEVQ